MRTTLDIDDDLLAAARDLARADGTSLGDVVSALMRRALVGPAAEGVDGAAPGFREAQATFDAGAWPVLPGRHGVFVGPSAVERVQEAIDREDMEAAVGATDGVGPCAGGNPKGSKRGPEQGREQRPARRRSRKAP